MNGACNGTFFCPAPLGPGEGPKGQISLYFNYKVNFKDFLTKFVCLLTHERYKACQAGFLIWPPGSCPRGGTCGYHGVGAGHFFSEI